MSIASQLSFRHPADLLAEDDSITMDDVIAVGVETGLGDDAVSRGVFTIVFADPDSETASPAPYLR